MTDDTIRSPEPDENAAPPGGRTRTLLAQPLSAAYTAVRARDMQTIAVLALALVAMFVPFVAYGHDWVYWIPMIVVGAQFLWLTHRRAQALRSVDPEVDVRVVYGAGILLSFPVAYGVLILMSIAAALAILAVAAAVIVFLIRLFTSGEGPVGTIARGANSHLNVDGTAKVPYGSVDDAQAAASLYFRDKGELMNAYKCLDGDHFHIGHAK